MSTPIFIMQQSTHLMQQVVVNKVFEDGNDAANKRDNTNTNECWYFDIIKKRTEYLQKLLSKRKKK